MTPMLFEDQVMPLSPRLLPVLLLLTAPAMAQDRRSVREPSLPTNVCTSLSSDGAGWQAETGRLQAAIDHCPSGAAVRLVSGTGDGRFVSGPLHMKSGVTLWLDRGTTLVAVPDPRAYDRGQGLCGTIADKGNACLPFISFEGTRGGGIMGDGAIDGSGGAVMTGHGESWWQLARRAQREGGKQNNPRLVEADHARDLVFYRTTFHNAPNFHVVLNDVQGATLWGVRIDTPADARNTDGIDPGASQDVTIAHSFIRTGDDDIAIKAGYGTTRYISILDDHLYAGHGLSIGSETNAGVSDILVRNVTLDGTTSGLRIKSDASRGGLVTRVRYEGICLRGNRRPIDFDTRYDADARGGAIPVYRDIVLTGVTGGDGTMVLRGHDAGHLLAVTLDSVRFDPAAVWQIENADITTGPGGVSPTPPGLRPSLALAGTTPDCTSSWVPFPSDR
ncbi:glycosyl hydrolase family 28 protein [uncultured Sphingomonas sp.]|uniref:glycoside hydrolase family 28 protein n=1 Tax=uncultured Sphingomonas sp. TaxID=158754 RepID=UPI0025E3C146|nr:glycosyl hydrolase family 28 protein [uncultured Sphingomonas sp.]